MVGLVHRAILTTDTSLVSYSSILRPTSEQSYHIQDFDCSWHYLELRLLCSSHCCQDSSLPSFQVLSSLDRPSPFHHNGHPNPISSAQQPRLNYHHHQQHTNHNCTCACRPTSSTRSISGRLQITKLSGPSSPPSFTSEYHRLDADFTRHKSIQSEDSTDFPPAFASSFVTEESPPQDGLEKAGDQPDHARPETKKDGSSKSAEDTEPPPPYDEGASPLDFLAYTMAASIITQVSQGGGGGGLSNLGGQNYYRARIHDIRG